LISQTGNIHQANVSSQREKEIANALNHLFEFSSKHFQLTNTTIQAPNHATPHSLKPLISLNHRAGIDIPPHSIQT
jgi:hypothetical protein